MIEHWENFVNGKPRAPRSTLEIPVQFRAVGVDAWRPGQMQNISRSGMLFTAPALAPLDSNLELSFALPLVIDGEPAATVICRGNVVRRIPAETPELQPALAIQIQEYDSARGFVPTAPPRR